MFELAFCCMLGRSPSDCAPSAALLTFGIGGIGGGVLGPLLVPLKRLLGGVGIFFGRSNGGAEFGAVSGLSDSAPSALGVRFSDDPLELWSDPSEKAVFFGSGFA
jgi:hypothetical protein